VSGFSGDGGPATSASLSFPIEFMVLDPTTDDLYFSDRVTHRIRRSVSSNYYIGIPSHGNYI